MSQENYQPDGSDHHPSENKLDEICSHPSAVSSLKHEGDNASCLNQLKRRTLPANGPSGGDLDVDHLLEELEGSFLKPGGNHASSDKQDDGDDGEEDFLKRIMIFTDDDDDDDFLKRIMIFPDDDDDDDDETCDDEEEEESFEESDDYIYDDAAPLYEWFERVYRCLPLSSVGKTHLDIGNKIIMPADALMPLLKTKISMPMQFEIRNNSTGRVSNCGVFEFTGQDTSDIFLPEWMMKNMQLQAGDLVTIKNKDLEMGTYIKLQPHSADFLGISNPKAVLEENLQNFSCLTTGDTIMISHGSKNFYINIVETKPSSAVNIINVDCNVDFAPPLDYKEPENCVLGKEKEKANQKPKFKPFTGLSRRLVEPTSMELDSAYPPNEHWKNDTAEAECMSKGSSQWDRSQPQNRGRELKNENVEAETSKDKPKFQPFTGKKYTLAG